ncbi:MAG: hypothetical protein IT581_11030 [Verrucomicrobiales bacterium]|nr:hypothetical protein [Verrucomicrobiales bacterium]
MVNLSDAFRERHLTLDATSLARARQQLIDAALLACEKPHYQDLGLDEPESRDVSPVARSDVEILRQVLRTVGGAW